MNGVGGMNSREQGSWSTEADISTKFEQLGSNGIE